MSRRKIFPSLSSSRQMMMAWKVSGLSQRPAIIASRPASMRFAMAISPSRDSNSTVPISRRYMRTGSSVRSPGSDFLTSVTAFCVTSTSSLSVSSSAVLFLFLAVGVVGLGDVDAHLREHRHDVLDLLRRGLVGGQHFVELIEGDEAALLGLLDHLLDGGVREIEQGRRRVGGILLGSVRCLVVFFLVLNLQRLCLGGHSLSSRNALHACSDERCLPADHH